MNFKHGIGGSHRNSRLPTLRSCPWMHYVCRVQNLHEPGVDGRKFPSEVNTKTRMLVFPVLNALPREIRVAEDGK